MSIARFEMGKPMERTTKRSGRMHRFVIGEIKADEPTGEQFDDAFDRGLELFVTGARVPIGRGVDPGSVFHHLAPGQPQRPHRFIAGHANCGIGKAFGEEFAATQPEQSDQPVVVVDMTIKRRLTDPKFFGNPGQRDGVESFVVGQSGCCIYNLVGVERGSSHSRHRTC